ncbi:hypothetical protein PM035_12915 [Halorubrum ezzemoulense]|uniref:hypothetical protein n=1 Tax=Halorubrum ezzemoulense TaxID=337243 RepID=UPI0023301075|nr:hypothetical protein [Halorubrum ezzemoulense]MDB2261827.1 hypothetical protein [Halorubrum ezzemoulense]MDB2268589.1 hypothetical protein [Halorubrum ezzemoulense]
MDILQDFFERENWRFELLMVPVALTYLSLTILILTEASESNQFPRTTDIVVSSTLSLLLVLLYFRQTSILKTQTDIQDEQTDILRASETPDVVMNEFLILPKGERRDVNKIGASFSNTGDGLAKNFEVTTHVQLPAENELEGGAFPRGLKREENSDIRGLAGDYIRAGEMGEPLTAELSLQIRNWGDDIEDGDHWMHTYNFEETVDVLTDHGVESMRIIWNIEWTDTFGRSEDAFGNEYREQHMESGDIAEDMTFAEFTGVADVISDEEETEGTRN